jgi:hypothetical protein
MGTGVGEAMLLGAAMGGGSAALTGGDPLKGALLGGLTGGAGAGIGGALGGAAAGTEAALATAGTEAATTATMANALPASSLASTPIAPGLAPGQSFAQASQLANSAAANQGITGAINSALPLSEGLGSTGITGLPSNFTPPTSPVIPTPPPVSAAPSTFTEGMSKFASDPMASLKANPFTATASGLAGAIGARQDSYSPDEYNGPLKRFRFNPETYRPAYYAEGGIADLGAMGYDRQVGEEPMYPVNMASGGGISNLGSYSDGGRMLRGPGDGMSDSIPASISGKRPARLADGEFVVPADVVSHLGNGSTDAGAKTLYGMMDKVRSARTGRKSQGREINPGKYMPA